MTRYSSVPKALFSTAIDDVATSFLKHRATPHPDGRFRKACDEALLSAAEALMIAPCVTFKVYGENVVLATLLQVFGVDGLEELLADGSVRFILWRGFIGHVADQNIVRQGVIPVAPVTLTTTYHTDPEVSCLAGMKWAPKVERHERRRLARLAAKKMDVSPERAPNDTWDALLEAHKNGDLAVDGFPAERPLSQTTEDEQRRLLTLGGQLLEAAVLVENQLDLHDSDGTWKTMLQTAHEVRSSGAVVRTAEEILLLEQLPSVRQLLRERRLTFADVLRLRRHPATSAFRQWLWTRPDPADAKAVLKEYEALFDDGKGGGLDAKFLRLARLVGLSATAFYLGDAAGGAVAAAAGAGLGIAANIAVGTGLSYFDALLCRIREGRSPRRFTSLLRDELILQQRAADFPQTVPQNESQKTDLDEERRSQ